MGQSVVKNPRRIFSQTSSSSASSGGGGVSIPTVANYASLPDPTTVAGEFRWVSTATGVYLVGLYYSDGISWSASEANEIIVVANYSALPAANTASGQFYWCSAAQGTSWLPGSLGGTYYNSGMYYSNGTTWEWLNVPYNATQAEVHTGVDNTKFVTPSTFAGEKDVTDGIVGLTGFNHNFKNTAGTFLSYFTNSNTASRTYTFQDAPGIVAFLSDITGSGTTELAAVISQTNTPAGSPTTGDRYLVGTVPTGAWVGNANNIAEWDGLSWTYTTPVLNNTVFVTATLTTLRYSGSSWIAYQGTAVLQNGNTLGTSLNIGTNDAQSVIVKVNGITRETNSTTINTVQIGTTSTNAMYRLDSAGFRIGTIATIGTANTVPFEITTNTANDKIRMGRNLFNSNIDGGVSQGGVLFSRADGSYNASCGLTTNNYVLDVVGRDGVKFFDSSAMSAANSEKAGFDWSVGPVSFNLGVGAKANTIGLGNIMRIYDIYPLSNGGTSAYIQTSRTGYSATNQVTSLVLKNNATTSSGTLTKTGVIVDMDTTTGVNVGIFTNAKLNGFGFGISLGYHPTTTPTATIDIIGSETTQASLRIRSGVAPTSPNDGDIWFDGTDLKMRVGGVTKTFTLV